MCLDKNDSNVPGYPKYTTLACMLTCKTKFVVEKCGCRDVGMPGKLAGEGFLMFSLPLQSYCLIKQLSQNNFRNRDHFSCFYRVMGKNKWYFGRTRNVAGKKSQLIFTHLECFHNLIETRRDVSYFV